MLCADLCVTLSVCVCTTPVCVFASQSRAPQGRLKSPRFKSGLYTKFRDHGFLLTLERACEAQIWKGILRFRRVKSSNFFWPAGAAPQGRRGRGASRPARPGKNVIRKNQPDSLKIAKIGKTNLGHQNGLTQGSVKILASSPGPGSRSVGRGGADRPTEPPTELTAVTRARICNDCNDWPLHKRPKWYRTCPGAPFRQHRGLLEACH